MPGTEPNLARRTEPATRAVRRAERQAERGDIFDAIISLDRAMQLGANACDCYLRQARLYQAMGRSDDAVSVAEKAVETNPDSMSAREAVLALSLALKDYPRAVAASKALLRLHPRHLPARDALGAAYMGLGDFAAAIRVATDLIRMDPDDPQHRFKKALLCQHEGEIAIAVAEMQRVLDMTEDGALNRAAREQLNSLDLHQLHAILLLAAEDPVFRSRLIQDSEGGILDRGFHLSQWGLRRLEEIVATELTSFEGEWTPRLYQ